MMDAFTSNNTKIIIQEEKEEEMKTSASASASASAAAAAAVSEEEEEDRDDDDLGKEEGKYCRRRHEEDEEEDYDDDEAYGTYAYRIEMVSNFFFFSASIFYLIQSIWDMQYANHIIGIPKDVLLLGDNTTEAAHIQGYDDDYVFGDDTIFTTSSKHGGYDVGLYTIIYFCGAVCFVFCGIADCCNPYETSCLAGFFFIVAGLFDLAASIFVDSSPELSNILDLVSSNLYLFEAIQLFCTFESGLNRNVLIWTCLAYIMFGGGACMDVIMGFVDTFANVNYSHSFAVLEVFDSVAWVGSAIILSVLTVYRRYYEDDDDDDEFSSSLSFDEPKMIKEISPSTDISSVEEDSDV